MDESGNGNACVTPWSVVAKSLFLIKDEDGRSASTGRLATNLSMTQTFACIERVKEDLLFLCLFLLITDNLLLQEHRRILMIGISTL